MEELFHLGDLEDFVRALQSRSPSIWYGTQHIAVNGLYCPKCGGTRRVEIEPIHRPFGQYDVPHGLYSTQDGPPLEPGAIVLKLVPSLYELTCVQCMALFTSLIHWGPNGPSLVVMPSCSGGLTTPHTPDGVAYYLDQAQKAQSLGANSAATAMYRGALEHLLFEQGYREGTCGKKIKVLIEDISSGKAPKWAMELDTEYLVALKDLGDCAIHPNDGDVTRQAALDGELIEAVKETFLLLLFLVYEVPHTKDARLAAMRAKAQSLKK